MAAASFCSGVLSYGAGGFALPLLHVLELFLMGLFDQELHEVFLPGLGVKAQLLDKARSSGESAGSCTVKRRDLHKQGTLAHSSSGSSTSSRAWSGTSGSAGPDSVGWASSRGRYILPACAPSTSTKTGGIEALESSSLTYFED
ncbi:unnamed protein product [Durusdinium trenchii]|uniref:Secreted protein n=1 Tax=Durusdinium trenchii TaxID=1381693 RepID=A0ABP0NE52_9DINO